MRSTWPQNLALAAALGVALLFALRQNTDPDLGFHLNTGRWIAAHHAVPRVDGFTYTVQGRPYLDQHWLYQTVLYGLWRLGGYRLLTLANAAVILAVFTLLLIRLRLAGVAPAPAALLLVLAAAICEWRFEIRPEVATWLFLMAVFVILDLRRLKGRNHLRWLPVLMLVWANCQSLFILGFAALGCALLGGRWKDGRWDPALVKWTLASVLAVNVNPYGVKGAFFFLELWRHLTQGPVASTIEEFRSPFRFAAYRNLRDVAHMFLNYYLLVAAGLLLLLASWRKRSPAEWMTWSVFFLLSATAARNVPLFVLASLPVTGACLMDALPGLGMIDDRPGMPSSALSDRRESNGLPLRWRVPGARMAWIATLVAAAVGIRVLTGAWYAAEKSATVPGLGIRKGQYPERAARYLIENGLADSRPVNDIATGNWIEWGCGMKVFADGRLEVLGDEMYLELLRTAMPDGFRLLADRWKADLLLFDPRDAPHLIYEQPKQLPDWTLLFAEESLLVYAPKERAARLPKMDWDAFLAERNIPRPLPQEAERLLGTPRRAAWLDWLEGFIRKREFDNGLGNLCLIAGPAGRNDVAEAILLHLLKRTRRPDARIFFNLAAVYTQTRRPDLARWAYQRCWEAGLRNSAVREGLGL